MYEIYLTAKSLAVPPGSLMVLFAVGIALLAFWPRLGKILLIVGLLSFYGLSTPIAGRTLIASLVDHEPLPSPVPSGICDAVVVLGGGVYDPAPEFAEGTIGASSLWRVHYAVKVAQESGAPLLLSGGRTSPGPMSEARAMQRYLESSLSMSARWLDEKSLNTYQQSQNIRQILQADGIDKICLVTHTLHMTRAQSAFHDAGFLVVPAPTDFSALYPRLEPGFVPSSSAFSNSTYAVTEWIGRGVNAARSLFGI